MVRRLKRILTAVALLLLSALLAAQNSTTAYAALWYWTGSRWTLTQLDGLLYDSASGHLKLPTSPAPKITAGLGIDVVQQADGSAQVGVDTAFVFYMTRPPSAPGACTMAGSGAITQDGSYVYFCVPDASGGGFHWVRGSPLQSVW